VSCWDGRGHGLAGRGLIPLRHLGFALGGPQRFGGLGRLLGFRGAGRVSGWAGGTLGVRLGLQRHRGTPGGS